MSVLSIGLFWITQSCYHIPLMSALTQLLDNAAFWIGFLLRVYCMTFYLLNSRTAPRSIKENAP